jgi:glyoxylase-like metal-dependent hydrolase (beta-lactamase superfamily II)
MNAWVVGCEETGEAVLIDPGDEPERIVTMVDRHGLAPVRILNTHGHLDHVGAVQELKGHYGIPFAIHEGERPYLERLRDQAGVFGLDAPPEPEVDEWIEDGAVYAVGRGALTVIATPGHTPGGVSFHGDGFVVVGDTLFAGSVGRTDLPGGDFETLSRSIRERLFELPPPTRVHCGHGPDTTIARERATNPFVGDRADPSIFGL